MGLSNSTFYASSFEENSSEDEEFLPRKGDPDMQADSLQVNVAPRQPCDQLILIERVAEIENQLDYFEKVSLVYLLYDEPKTAYERLLELQQHEQRNVLGQWILFSVPIDNNWRKKLLEALCIIQNYEIICKLGCNETEVREKFAQSNKNSFLFINVVKKNLYNICENLTNDQTDQFLAVVQSDFEEKELPFKQFDQKYLEFYFSHWMEIEYISLVNLSSLYQPLQAIEKQEFVENLKLLAPDPAPSSLKQCRALDLYFNEHFAMQDQMQNYTDDNCYAVDPKCPGICLIINQEVFYPEPDPSVLVEYYNSETEVGRCYFNEALDYRQGSKIDRDKLEYTFNKFGFKVIVTDNRTHWELEEEIQKTVNMVTNQSSLIICILSHGIEGMVYGVNGIPVKVEKMLRLMCTTNPNLKNKPKILILQSCQGTKYQQVTNDGEHEINLQTNGHGGTTLLAFDMLVFWATVRGYAAIREIQKGTWFIQSLCDTILQEGKREHFGDICTSVVNKIRNKRCETKIGTLGMVSVWESTLTKKFYLPCM